MAKSIEYKIEELGRVGCYEMVAEPFHSDFRHELQYGHLGNYMLNAADFHSTDRDFGMRYLNTINKTWVLSRLCIEMNEMPLQYSRFSIETWVENAMRYFTQRNFRVVSPEGKDYGYGRSVWALIDTETRQPTDLMNVHDGDILQWVEKDKLCPIDKPGRVKMSKDAEYVGTIDTHYCDVDVNGHINSVKYIEHILDVLPFEWHKKHHIKRFDIAYVAESYCGDKLNFYVENISDDEKAIRITKTTEGNDEQIEVVRCLLKYAID